MSSNREKGMVKRSDFAQKLLDDLRVRKERLSISQDTDNYAYSNRGFKGYNRTRAKSTTFQDFNYGGANFLTSGTEASNQILPYGQGRSMEKIDLSKALAFALENAGKATRADPSGNASIISFLHEVGKRSLGFGAAERRSTQQQFCSSSQQLPMVHVQIKEISKGAQKLNQIIKACSNGLSFRKGRYSIQYGEEHMEGAIELEQSLRLLVDIQQASSEYMTKRQSKNRIKLLEENDDEEDEEDEDLWNRNNRKIKETAKADIETRLLALNNKHRRQTSSREYTEHKPQKGRIPNVVAKLMGIGEFPEEEKETKNNNDASIKYADSLTRSRVTQSNENIVELKDQRNSTSLDLVFHKETQRSTNGMNYKDKSQQNNDSNSRKGNKGKNAIRRNSSPTEDKPKAVTRSQEKPLHKLSFGKKDDEAKSIKKVKLKPKRHQEHRIMTNHPPVDIKTKVPPVTEKAKALRKSFSHVEVLEKKKGREVHEAEFLEKKNQDTSNLNGGFCKAMKQPENQEPLSKEANGKQDQLLKSYNESNKTKAVEAETSIKTSEDSGVEVQSSNINVSEKKNKIKDDSILLIAAERVLCQAPSDNHHELMFTDGVDQQAPISNSDRNSESFSKTVYKASKGEVEADIPLLEKRQEHRKQETKETLSENEMNLKKIVVKSQLFLDTVEAFFKLNIPLDVLHEVGENNYYQEDKNLLLDCGYELMKRKGRFQELSVHPFVKVPTSSSKVDSLDHLVRQLSKEFEKLRTYGRECYTESLVEDYLPKVLDRDVYYKDPNLNSMWDMGWNDSMNTFIEKDDVIRDIEREVFNGLLEEITRDLICI